jgi:phosphatidate cytidylyltransferase
MHFEVVDWRQVLVLLFVVTFGMDTGAWFFGKNFGKRKLWPEVSPNKTVEGLFGGMFTSALLGGVFWYIFFSDLSLIVIFIFALCGAISQVGDLIQSKIKREYAIKDSSALIPGHGGVYDRIDSLIFLSPFFIIVVRYLKHLN